jgi:hypothetical protein
MMGLWSARAGAARPRCPQARPRPPCRRRSSAPWHPASAGAWRASARSCCARLARRERRAELLSRELGLPICKLDQWRQKAEAALDGALKEREAEAAGSELAAAMQRIGELSMEVELLRARIERPALWPGGGRAGERDLPRQRPALWHPPRLPGLGRAALQRPCRPDAETGQRHPGDPAAAPDVMWAIDATQVSTVRDGKVWLFGVAEHWNAELLGWHVTKSGTRFEATQALGMAVRQQFGHLSADAARGLALRHDHGSQSMAEHVQNQARF